MKSNFFVLSYEEMCALQTQGLHQEKYLNSLFKIFKTSDKIDSIEFKKNYRRDRTNSIIGLNDFNSKLNVEYNNILKSAPDFAASILNLNGFVAVGPNGLLFDLENNICIVGENFGWHRNFAKWWSEKSMNAGWSADLGEMAVDFDFKSNNLNLENSIFISQPGQDIYGHWILDIIPRLFLLRETGMDKKHINIGEIPHWAFEFLEIFGIDKSKYSILLQDNVNLSHRIYVPSFLKFGFTIDRDICARSWKYFLNKIRLFDKIKPETVSRKIYVSRKKWNSNRSIKNTQEVEDVFENRGYRIVFPENFLVKQQYEIFKDALIIIGQDGSGLHNIIFCENEQVSLGVISTKERVNMWHISICDALDHKIAYMKTIVSDIGEEFVDINELNEFIDRIESRFVY